MAQLSIFLNLEKTKEALKYYEEVFMAKKITRIPVSEEMRENFKISPETNLDDTTMFGSFEVEGNLILACDNFLKQDSINNSFSLMIDYDSESDSEVKKMQKLYESVVEGGVTITMPLAEQPWGGSMAQIIDKYGVSWMLHSQPYSKKN